MNAEDLQGAKQSGWVRRHYFKPWILIATTKGRFHTSEWMRRDDDLRAAIHSSFPAWDEMTLNEQRAAQVQIAVLAWRLNEDAFEEASRNLEEYGIDLSDLLPGDDS